ncbi:PREDICTED: leucine-rich repeat transmembrane protein FLRT1-like [Condylura cristata]|uniref:leucine-rich repeat transmembrane protein FLRT1-like n=1 Tax=Condylura cristata TaxID=143302 RepID=UPI0003347DEC|nr:PREDICTED: leucine-rich repeat transmembrane protein FLRT1-like [Condylura cristata]
MYLCYTFLVLLSLSKGFNSECPRRCSCDSAEWVQCYRLTGLPSGIPATTKSLYISHSKIQHLQLSNFTKMLALEDFILLASGTESVENDTFKTLSNLKTLELWKNKLRQVPSTLPASLQVLKLNDNSIYVLHESDFEGLKKLKILELKNNLISSLAPRTLTPLVSLQSLVLDDNNIEYIAGPLTLPQLTRMSMENNKLHLIPANFFAFLQSLQFLSFSGNSLTKIPNNLPKSLLSLKMERNQLKVVRFRDMKHLENLSHLYLSKNALASIDGAQLLANLTTLELSQNQLQMLPLRLPTRLQKLDISNNLIQRVTVQDFQDLRDLKHLFLDNNIVSVFEAGALQRCSQLSNLALEQNLLLSIPLRLPRTLARLDLKGNAIRDIAERELKDLKQLQVLNLRNNKISALDLKALEGLPRLRHLYLDGNPWNCTCSLLRAREVLKAKGTDVKGGQCAAPAERQGESWMSSKKIMRHCEHHLLLTEKNKETKKKSKLEEHSSIRVNMDDDYYDYEID